METDNSSTTLPRKYAGFQKGNPYGRKPGQPTKRTQFLNAIGKKNCDDIIKVAIEAAKNGKSWAVLAVMERLYAVPKSRTVTFPIAEIHSVDDIAAAYSGLWGAVSTGLLSPDEAVALSGILKDHAAVLGESALEKRIRALEDELAKRVEIA
jgi:hypothetical protein